MKVVLNTNVLVSGIFFGGVPGRILEGSYDFKIVSPRTFLNVIEK